MGGNSASALSQRQSSSGGAAESSSGGDAPSPSSPPPTAPAGRSLGADGPQGGPQGGQTAPSVAKQRQSSMALPGGSGGERRRQMSLAEPGARAAARPSVGGDRAGRLSLIPGRGRQASLVEALGCVGQPEDDEEDAEPPPDLTDHEKELLTTSWKEIENNVAQVGVITFISLFETHPDVQEVFMPFNGIELEDLKHSKQLRAHALRVMAFVQKAVARLNEPEKLQTLVRDLGRKHVGYGAKRRYVDLIGPQFIQAIKPSLEPQWSDEMHEAWSRLFLHLSFVMKGSMLEEERRVKAAPKGR